MVGSAGVAVQGLDSGRLAAASVCRRLPLTWAGRNASSPGVVVLLMTPEQARPQQLGFAMCLPVDGTKRDILGLLVPFKVFDQRDFPVGEAFVQLRLLLDVFPVSCYMKKRS